jgi:hypothetical protein
MTRGKLWLIAFRADGKFLSRIFANPSPANLPICCAHRHNRRGCSQSSPVLIAVLLSDVIGFCLVHSSPFVHETTELGSI